MGLLKALFSGAGSAFNRMAKSFKEILDNLAKYRMYGDTDYLYKAVWLLKYGVYDSIEKWHWSSFAKIFIPDHQELGRITLNEAILIVMGKITSSANSLSDEKRKIIENIMEGGDDYSANEYLISLELKNKLKP